MIKDLELQAAPIVPSANRMAIFKCAPNRLRKGFIRQIGVNTQLNLGWMGDGRDGAFACRNAPYKILGYGPLVVVVLAPLAGWFYHKKSTRSEQVRLRVDTVGDRLLLIVTGHRDELAALRDNLTLEEIET